jgi:hypothetical protein
MEVKSLVEIWVLAILTGLLAFLVANYCIDQKCAEFQMERESYSYAQ